MIPTILLLLLLLVICESNNLRIQSDMRLLSAYENMDEGSPLVVTAAAKTGSSGNSGNSTSSGNHASIFGNVTSIGVLKGSLSILLIVVIVLVLEHLFRGIQESTIDTPFEGMVVAIKNEMMIVGCMAFLFRIIVGAGSPDMIEHDWYFALEYADTLVPITSFCFCFEGLLLVYMSMRQLGIWTRSYRLKLVEIFHEYYIKSSASRLPSTLYYLPISTVHAVMEFRIMSCIFCEEYYVLPNAFPFHQYAVKVMEKSMTEMVELQPMDWFVVVVLVFLNWGRNSLHGSMVRCHHHAATDDHSLPSDDYLHCKANDAMQLFAVFGAVMFILTLLLAILSRLYELRVLACHGVLSADDYVVFLSNYEVNGNVGSKKSAKLDEELFRSKIEDIKVRHALAEEEKVLKGLLRHNEKMKSHPTPYRSLNDICMDAIANCSRSIAHNLFMCFTSKSNSNSGNTDNQKMMVVPTIGDEPNNSSSWKSGQFMNMNMNTNTSNRDLASPTKAPRLLSRNTIYRSYMKCSPEFGAEEVTSQGATSGTRARARTASDEYQVSVNSRRRKSVSPAHRLNQMKKLHDTAVAATGKLELGYSDKLASLFLFKSPLLYFASIRISIMIISFYNSLWLTNFLQSSISQLHSSYWGIVSLLPGVLSFVAYMYIARSAALLKAMVYLDFECIEETLDDVETSRKIAEEMRQKLRLKLPDRDLPVVQQLQDIFDNIDAMSRLKFQTFLEGMSIVFSRRKWSQIFSEIDRNFDDAVSLQELLIFLYHDDTIIQQVEHEYLDNVKHRLKDFMNVELLSTNRGNESLSRLSVNYANGSHIASSTTTTAAGAAAAGGALLEEQEDNEAPLSHSSSLPARFDYSKTLSALREENSHKHDSATQYLKPSQAGATPDSDIAEHNNLNTSSSITAVRLPPLIAADAATRLL